MARCLILCILSLLNIVLCAPPQSNLCGCSYDYVPVCGSNGQTYVNACLAGCEADHPLGYVTIKHAGPCKGDVYSAPGTLRESGQGGGTEPNRRSANGKPDNISPSRRNHATSEEENKDKHDRRCKCTDKYEPVCAKNLKTYKNACLALCDLDVRFFAQVISHDGPCYTREHYDK